MFNCQIQNAGLAKLILQSSLSATHSKLQDKDIYINVNEFHIYGYCNLVTWL